MQADDGATEMYREPQQCEQLDAADAQAALATPSRGRPSQPRISAGVTARPTTAEIATLPVASWCRRHRDHRGQQDKDKVSGMVIIMIARIGAASRDIGWRGQRDQERSAEQAANAAIVAAQSSAIVRVAPATALTLSGSPAPRPGRSARWRPSSVHHKAMKKNITGKTPRPRSASTRSSGEVNLLMCRTMTAGCC